MICIVKYHYHYPSMIFVIDNWVSVTVVFCIVNWSQIWQLSDNGPCVCLVIPSVVNITFSHISHQSCSSFEDTTLHLTTFTNILRERGRGGLIEDILRLMPKTGRGLFCWIWVCMWHILKLSWKEYIISFFLSLDELVHKFDKAVHFICKVRWVWEMSPWESNLSRWNICLLWYSSLSFWFWQKLT